MRDAAGEEGLDHQPLIAGPASPYSIEAERTCASRLQPPARVRREPDVVHEPEGGHEHHEQDDTAKHERDAEARLLRDEAACDGADKHRAPLTI